MECQETSGAHGSHRLLREYGGNGQHDQRGVDKTNRVKEERVVWKAGERHVMVAQSTRTAR